MADVALTAQRGLASLTTQRLLDLAVAVLRALYLPASLAQELTASQLTSQSWNRYECLGAP